MSFQTPVVFIIYNRPQKMEQVFSVIKKIQPSKLFIIADGPKNDSDKLLCDQTKAILEKIDWDVDLKNPTSDFNMGNVSRTIAGLNWVFEQVEQSVILEDDCVPHLSFFNYCETLLNYYKNDFNIMHISGCNLLQKAPADGSSYFFEIHCSAMGVGYVAKSLG